VSTNNELPPGTFLIVHPHQARGGPSQQKVVKVLPGGTTSLHVYFKQLNLNGVRSSCRVVLATTQQPLRVSYVPKPGDFIVMTPASRGGAQ
jgi:hypothetical protein